MQPHHPQMLASFTNHLIAVMDDPDQAEAALQALITQEQYAPGDLEVLSGEAGEDRLDFSGERHGLLARWRRQIQALTDEYQLARRYEDELRRGRYLLLVQVSHEDQARRLCHLLQTYGGHFIHYYGPLIVESFCPDTEQ